MKLYKFTVVFIPEKGKRDTYNASVPALPGCLSFGESLAEARYNIREAIELYLETLVDDDQPIPKDRISKIPKHAIAEEITVGIDYHIRAGFEKELTPVINAR